MTVIGLSVFTGVIISVAIWQAFKVFNEVPESTRPFLDRPPFGFRLIWPLIQVFDYYAGSLISEQQRQFTQLRLKKAGMDFKLLPEQFIAAKVVSSISFGAAMAVAMLMLGRSGALLVLLGAVGGFYYPELWLKEASGRRADAILRSLPFYLDIITLSVEAGSNLTGGLTQAIQKSTDTPLRVELNRVLRDVRAGKTRADALRDMAERSGSPALQSVVSNLIQAERTGSSLGPILRAQADQLRSERFQRAEKQAMEAPVKLLGPLVIFIFPTTFLVLGYLVLSKSIQEQVVTWAPLVWAYHWPG